MSGSGASEGPVEPVQPAAAPVAEQAPAQQSRDWRRRVITIALSLVAVVVIYAAAAAFIPRWWANRIGHSVNGQLSTGALLGFCFGVVFTILPLGLLWLTLRRHLSWKLMVMWLLVAAVLAAPNLMTLGVAVGGGSGSHAGQRTMDVLAPMFRGATLIGALLAIAVFVVVVIAYRRKVRRAEAEAQAEAEAEAAAQAGGSAGPPTA